MNKSEIINTLSVTYGYKKTEAEVHFNRVMDTLVKVIPEHDAVKIRGFGSFNNVERKARVRKNPNTGEFMEIPRRRAVTFTPSKQMREALQEAGDRS